MLVAFGAALYENIADFNNHPDSVTESIVLFFLGSIFLVNLISLILVIIKSSKSIFLLNVFYIYFLLVLIFGFAGNYINDENYIDSSYMIVNILFIIVLASLIFLINKFKFEKLRYENIEAIGTQND